jgi:hypothetical protein
LRKESGAANQQSQGRQPLFTAANTVLTKIEDVPNEDVFHALCEKRSFKATEEFATDSNLFPTGAAEAVDDLDLSAFQDFVRDSVVGELSAVEKDLMALVSFQ